jgi:hypothetical protein
MVDSATYTAFAICICAVPCSSASMHHASGTIHTPLAYSIARRAYHADRQPMALDATMHRHAPVAHYTPLASMPTGIPSRRATSTSSNKHTTPPSSNQNALALEFITPMLYANHRLIMLARQV